MRIAIITIWFHRGQTVVNQTIKQALEEAGHEVYIHARMGAVYGQEKQERVRYGWQTKDITFWPEYILTEHIDSLINIFREQNIDLVLFNEEYDFALVESIKQAGFKVGTYMDYVHKGWIIEPSPFRIYDFLICSTKRTYEMVKGYAPAHYVGWGIPGQFRVKYPWEKRPYLFFLNAGWIGINDRKGLGVLLIAYQKLVTKHPGAAHSLLIHSQVGTDTTAPLLKNVDIMMGTMNLPGLYHMAQVYVYPAKLDGLGLSMLEAMVHDMVIICPDAPPWNEFVTDGYNGFLIPIKETQERDDGIAFPEVIIDEDALLNFMEKLYVDPGMVKTHNICAEEAKEILDWNLFRACIHGAIQGVAS